ncbi:MAG TPA: hypothetical protein DD670_16485 [Planctomycetaceae bacterium]|nr:hypothetical protein [Planctomycetaceae bacterium]
MRNTTAVTLRAMVMLACLVLIPAIAVFGKSLPGLTMRLIEDGWTRWTARSEQPRPVAPAFDADQASAPWTPDGHPARPTDDGVPTAPRYGADGSVAPAYGSDVAAPRSDSGLGSPSRAEVPVGYHAQSDSDAAPVRLPATFPLPSPGPDGSTSPGYDQRSALPNARGQADPWPSMPSHDQSAGPGVAQEPMAGSGNGNGSLEGGAFLMIQERLRDMGAVSYRLETWGDRHQLYRFQCEITVHGSPHLTRHFEATDGHPLLAMHKVLVEAEAWQASR